MLAAMLETHNGYCLTSTLSVVVTSAINGLVVACSNYSTISFAITPVGNTTISVVAPPNVPNITSLITTCSDQITVTWTSVPTVTSYNVSINDSVNTVYSVSTTGSPQYMYTFTGLTNRKVYSVSVVAINCAGSSNPAVQVAKQFDLTTTSSKSSGETCAVGLSIDTAVVGVSVSVTFVVSFSMGVLVASVLCYISRRSKESSSSQADPATVYDEVHSNKKMKRDTMMMNTNTAYGSHASQVPE
eukprot:Em0025g42a